MIRFFKYKVVLLLALICCYSGLAQGKFIMENGKDVISINFKLKSNLIVFPMQVNGKELNFILDSGVGSTILFNLNARDSVQLNTLANIKLRGLGSEEPVDAILSRNNEFKLKNIRGIDQKLYVISNDNFDMSAKIGMTIHGIIGFELFKDFIIKINYGKGRLTFYNPDTYVSKDCRKCETFPLEFNNLKAYVNVGAQLDSISDTITPVKLLIDSGGSDAMWLFENSLPEIKPPKKYFRDFLGEGLSGAIFGKRSKIKGLVLGKFVLKNPTVSFPDSVAIAYASKFKERNGSLGGSILKRFTVTFDYPNHLFVLKKGSHFKDAFRYNMSGIELAHNGKILVKEKDNTTFSLIDGTKATKHTRVTLEYKYKFTFKSSYIIQKLRSGSPAHEAGLLIGDILIKINGLSVFEMKMEEIVEKFYQKENRRISLLVERDGQHYTYNFRLRDVLK